MKVIGVLGGIASGKSLVSEYLQRLGADVLDADKLGHEVLRDPEVKVLIRSRWGDKVLDADGEINRGQVARIVFADPPAGREELAYLEQVTHPRIGQRLQETLDRLRGNKNSGVLVLDAALLLEAGWDCLCDQILFVDAPRPIRLARAQQRGWTETEFAAREAAQLDVAAKRDRADFLIDNSLTPEHTLKQLERVWKSLNKETSKP